MIEFSPDSIDDLEAIRVTIAGYSRALADKKIAMLDGVITFLEEYPSAGREYSNAYRVFSKERWIIIYRPVKDGVFISRVFDSSQNWKDRFVP